MCHAQPKNAEWLCYRIMDPCGVLKEYQIVGRSFPTPKLSRPPIYRMRIFSKNEVIAKSRFWYFLRQLKKIKKSKGEILDVKEIPSKNTKHVKNVGIWFKAETRTKTLNMYKEYRDTTINGAVNRCYSDIAGSHRVRATNIQVIQSSIVPPSQCKKKKITQFHDNNIKFPLLHRVTKAQKKNTFLRRKPCTVA